MRFIVAGNTNDKSGVGKSFLGLLKLSHVTVEMMLAWNSHMLPRGKICQLQDIDVGIGSQ
jgi:hypothetical protein